MVPMWTFADSHWRAAEPDLGRGSAADDPMQLDVAASGILAGSK